MDYSYTLQDSIGQLNKLLGGQAAQPQIVNVPAESQFDLVDGIEGARKTLHNMLPNTKRVVWDINEDVFFILQKDSNGQEQRIKRCPFTIEIEPTPDEKYVTKDDFNALVSKLDAFMAKREVKSNG